MVNRDKIPLALRDLPHWIVWKQVTRDNKPTKLPYQCNDQLAKSDDRRTWTTFDAAWSRYKLGGYDGPGFVFSDEDPYCGIDLDGCRDPKTGKVSPWARDIMLRMDSYCEVSPSQTGVKIFIRGRKPDFAGAKKELHDVEQVCGKKPAVEIYDTKRYFAVTGQRVRGFEQIEPRQPKLEELCKQLWPQTLPRSHKLPSDPDVAERARKYIATMPPAVSGSNGHGATFHVACVLVLGFGLSEGDAFSVLAEYNARCEPPWSEKDLWHKIRSAAKQPGERNYLRDKRPDEWDSISVPSYAESLRKPDAKAPLRVLTIEETARNYLDAVKSGKETLIELGIPRLDYALAGGVAPGEVVILAARPSHGKSALALQVLQNVTGDLRPSLMVSEEMSAMSLGKRTLQFVSDVPEEHWKTSTPQVAEQLDYHFERRAQCFVIENCRSAERVADEIRKAVVKHKVEVVAVDYAQLLQSPGRGRYEQITNTSVTLRQVTNETKVVLLLLCQLNREIENRNKFMPKLSDLRDTGQLEQDADVIVFQVWPVKVNPSHKPHDEYQVFIAKNRNRAINEVAVLVRFDPTRQTIHDRMRPVREHPNYNPDLAAWNKGSEPDNKLF